ncbi:hypothetical protein RQ831_16505 [Roseomonas gilardii]|uniref:Uncharacterized protein n=1 Tax=Roseomonas gilardii TaxID=257708 RepID=A0ABU3MI41_9PROT|nr:hypothetical protein [Roseomonas gilardii]MDT8332661.1 hypothetical protein [Roseomonas gilardii]
MTQAAMTAFAEVCVTKFGDQAAMDAWLRLHPFSPAAPQAAQQLAMGKPGHVWLRTEPKLPMAVITRASGDVLCQVMAPTAEPELAAKLFSDTLLARSRPDGAGAAGIEARKDQDEEVTLGQRRGRRVFIRLGRKPVDVNGGLLLALTAAPPQPGGVALLMTASRAAPVSR